MPSGGQAAGVLWVANDGDGMLGVFRAFQGGMPLGA